MTRIFPDSSQHAWRLRQLQDVLLEEQLDDAEILRRIYRHRAKRLRPSPAKRRLISVTWGVILGGVTSGTALAWAVHSGYGAFFTGSFLFMGEDERPSGGSERRQHRRGESERPAGTATTESGKIPAEGSEPSPVRQISDGGMVKQGVARDRVADPVPKPTAAVQLSGASPRDSKAVSSPEPDRSKRSVLEVNDLNETDRAWMQVSQLLREGRYGDAEQALHPLLAAGDVRARQAGLILRFQLRLHSGSSPLSVAERRELEQLADSGSAASIRRSARRLLTTMP